MATSSLTKRVSYAQLQELRELGAKYAKGVAAGSRELLSQVFSEDAIVYGDLGGKMFGGSIEKLYQLLEDAGPCTTMTYHVDVVEVLPTLAVIRVHLDNYGPGLGYEDYLSAYKFGTAWRVVSKITTEYAPTK